MKTKYIIIAAVGVAIICMLVPNIIIAAIGATIICGIVPMIIAKIDRNNYAYAIKEAVIDCKTSKRVKVMEREQVKLIKLEKNHALIQQGKKRREIPAKQVFMRDDPDESGAELVTVKLTNKMWQDIPPLLVIYGKQNKH